MGVFITYIVFLCTTVNGPLVTSITGAIGWGGRKRLPCLTHLSLSPLARAGNATAIVQTVLGAVLVRDFTPTVQNVAGILVSFAGTGKRGAQGRRGDARPLLSPLSPRRHVLVHQAP